MKRAIIYVMILTTYVFIDILIFFLTPMLGNKRYFLTSLFVTVFIWVLTILVIRKFDRFSDLTSKIKLMKTYYNVNLVDKLFLEDGKKHFYDMINLKEEERELSILTIKLVFTNKAKKVSAEKKTELMKNIISIINKNVESNLGIIYTMKDEMIICAFNALYTIESKEMGAINAGLAINIDRMKLNENDVLKDVKLNMSIYNEKFRCIYSNYKLLITGNLSKGEDLSSFEDTEFIISTSDIIDKYEKELYTEYLGKYYFKDEDLKIYKISGAVKIDKEDKFKLNIKKGKEKILKKYVELVTTTKMKA